MSVDNFSASLSNLLSDVDPRQHVTSIKTAVAERLREADPAVRIGRTEYFNHTYAPDLILDWGGDTRRLYLRTTQRPDYLLDDLAIISDAHPILMSLGDLPTEEAPDEGEPVREPAEAEESVERQLAAASYRTRTLVTDPGSLGTLSDRRKVAPVVGVFSRALLRGGRGLVDAPRAERASADLDVGWSSANTADAAGTSRAIDTAESLLDLEQANQVTRLLQVAWIGSGAPASSFPATVGSLGLLESDNLRFLLDLESVEDDEFWTRVGYDLRLEHLADLGTVAPANENFQKLVLSALPRLRAHGCRVVASDVVVKDATTRWFVQKGHLGLDHGAFRTYFAIGRVADLPVAAPEQQPIPLGTVLARAAEAEVELAEVAMVTTEGRQLDYRADDATDIKNDSVLNRVSSVAGKGSTVRSVMALSGSKRMVCDLLTSTARGRTRADFFVSELLRIAVPLFRALTSSERESLAALAPVVVIVADDDPDAVVEGVTVEAEAEVDDDLPSE